MMRHEIGMMPVYKPTMIERERDVKFVTLYMEHFRAKKTFDSFCSAYGYSSPWCYQKANELRRHGVLLPHYCMKDNSADDLNAIIFAFPERTTEEKAKYLEKKGYYFGIEELAAYAMQYELDTVDQVIVKLYDQVRREE